MRHIEARSFDGLLLTLVLLESKELDNAPDRVNTMQPQLVELGKLGNVVFTFSFDRGSGPADWALMNMFFEPGGITFGLTLPPTSEILTPIDKYLASVLRFRELSGIEFSAEISEGEFTNKWTNVKGENDSRRGMPDALSGILPIGPEYPVSRVFNAMKEIFNFNLKNSASWSISTYIFDKAHVMAHGPELIERIGHLDLEVKKNSFLHINYRLAEWNGLRFFRQFGSLFGDKAGKLDAGTYLVIETGPEGHRLAVFSKKVLTKKNRQLVESALNCELIEQEPT